jgi:hypothetical protein
MELYKIDMSGTNCFGRCANDSTLYALGPDNKGCFGPCPRGSVQEYKKDALGVECFGPCPTGSVYEWKTDVSGTQCYGKCDNNNTLWKKDISGTECFGRCPTGSYFRWKSDPSGSKCYGPCPNGLPGFKRSMQDTCITPNSNIPTPPPPDGEENLEQCVPTTTCPTEQEVQQWGIDESESVENVSLFSKYLRNFFLHKRIMGS